MSSGLYGVMAEFRHAEALVEAAHRARDAGYRDVEAYSPFPVDGLADAVGFRGSRVPLIVFVAGLLGGLGGFFMQWYSAVISYPINSGGKPLNSWPAFIPVTFELTVLAGAVIGFIGLLALNGLPRLYHPVFNVREFDLASRNRFFLCLPGAEAAPARRFLETLDPLGVWDVPQ